MTTPLPKTLDLSLAAEGVGNAVIVPAETDGPYFTLIGQGDATDEEQNAIAREIVRRWNEWREPVPTTPPLTAARIEEIRGRRAKMLEGPWRDRPCRRHGLHSIETEVPCINGLRAWFQVAVLFPREIEEEMIEVWIDRESIAAFFSHAPADIAALLAEVERLRAALRFYAKPPRNDATVPVPDFYDELSFGDTARAALGEDSSHG